MTPSTIAYGLEDHDIRGNEHDGQPAALQVAVGLFALAGGLTQGHDQADHRYAGDGHGHYLREEGGAHVVFHHVLDAHGFHEQEDAEGHEHQGNDQILFLV